jgi:tRNA-specific 2-thiouridylase
MESVRDKRIYVGLSGGVDSAVTAALLKKAGAHVTGVFIKGWYPPGMPCTWGDDRRDAMRVAARLHIPFLTLDASAEYKKGVIDYLISEYAAGRTPNPDIMCNRDVKFGAFYAFARSRGADFIATGHYAREEQALERRYLHRGIDHTKDQSYFLWAIPQEALDQSLFPLGTYHKVEVRSLAKAFQLPVATKKDSQGICFLGSISVDEFLRAELCPEQGMAVDSTGAPLGTHDGAVLYTLGARIALRDTEQYGTKAGPWYVQKKDMRTNTLTLSHTHLQPPAHEAVHFTQSNWFGIFPSPVQVTAQYRYHGPLIHGVLTVAENRFMPDASLPEPVAAGQSIVFYQGERCVGGGSIV